MVIQIAGGVYKLYHFFADIHTPSCHLYFIFAYTFDMVIIIYRPHNSYESTHIFMASCNLRGAFEKKMKKLFSCLILARRENQNG